MRNSIALILFSAAAQIAAGQQEVTSLTLINADTDLPIAAHSPLLDGASLDLNTLPTRNLNIQANTSPTAVGSVRFGYDGNANYRTESTAPYAFEGDNAGNYEPWTPTVGSHSVTATPYTAANGGGSAGAPLTINFTVTDSNTGGGENPSGSGAWIESGGMVVIEPESGDLVSDWVARPSTFTTDPTMAGSLGDGWLEWTGAQYFGNTQTEAQVNGIITYNFEIETEGDYIFVWRTKQYNEGTFDSGNDNYVRFNTGTAVSGYQDFGNFTKVWVQSKDAWSWTTTFEPVHGVFYGNGQARRHYTPGTHSIQIAARSPGHSIDRIVLYHTSVTFNQNNFESAPESERSGGSTSSLIFDATEDFPTINGGEVPYYIDNTYDALAIDAANTSYRDKFARAQLTFNGTSDDYDVTITTLTEEDGECTYRLLVDGAIVGTYQNPRVGNAGDLQPHTHTWSSVTINNGVTVAIESNTDSNDLILEGGVGPEFAWARGRWQQIELVASVEPPPPSAAENTPSAGVYGETDNSSNYKKWHRVTVAFEGPSTSEDATTNPFTDYRLNVTFTHPVSGKSYLVPGYYAADGNAGESGANSGNIWRAHFSPDEIGTWNYSASFRTGSNIAINSDAAAGSSTSFDGASGSFNVVASDKTGLDLRGKGRLEYDDTRYLKFAETGDPFLKVGADAPENFLAYSDFDNTYNHGGANYIKSWAPHVQDWNTGDPAWKSGKGKGIIGAINYLASEGQNVFSFLTYNAGGDSKDVWPYISHTDPFRFDCSKLDQWEIIFTHGDRMGMYLHFKTQETENDDLSGPGSAFALDDGNLGNERKLYYRELIARFGHHLALNWNLGEENTQTTAQQRDMAQFFYDNDPYGHNIVLHTYPGEQELRYRNLLGTGSKLTGASVQINYNQVHQETLQWIDESTAAGKPWVVANDEQGPANYANPPDDGYPGYAGGTTPSQKQMRAFSLWGNLMAGGAGIELYAGYLVPESDLTLQDFRSRDRMWDYNRHALNFFEMYLPFAEMDNANDLIGNTSDDNSKYCFAKEGEVYAIYLPNGGSTNLNLSAASGDFNVYWYDPRDGGDLQTGSVASVSGGNNVSLGTAPSDTTEDWAILVKRSKQVAYIHGDVSQDGTVPSGAAAPYDQMLLTDSGSTGLSQFKTMVEAEGYSIDQFYDQTTTLDASFLDNYDVVIFGLHQKIWSSAEKTALNDWLQAGGGMLIYSDSAAGGKFDVVGAQNTTGQTVVNNLISSYGMEVTVDQANGIKAYRAGPSASHGIVQGRPILEGEGVSPIAVDPTGSATVLIPYINNSDYKVSGDPNVPHQQNLTISNPDFAALALRPVGSGNIIAMFDRQPMWNNGPGSDIEERDNEEILRRIVRFLAGDLINLGLPFVEDFESHINGQAVAENNGWQKTGTGTADVQNIVTNGGNLALELKGEVDVQRELSTSQNLIWCDMNIRPAANPVGLEPDVPAGSSVAMFFDESGYLNLRNGASWIIPAGLNSINLSEWQRISIELNYSTQQYSVWLNDVRIAQNYSFANSDSSFSGIQFVHTLDTSTYLDNISADTIEPNDLDNDGDGLSNSWEIAKGLDPDDNGSSNPSNGPSGNPDGDTFDNLTEFALDLDPFGNDSHRGPKPQVEEVSDVSYVGIVYRENTMTDRIVYTIESSSDLSQTPWTNVVGEKIVLDPDPDSDGSSRLVQVRTPMTTDTVFLRLRTELP
ncbi:DUF5060 domain-containing protein [Rubellicoccus peritrichatus]|uniref:DUF5060 domain-containing protein n=1 Tax=Rubellicoccus peritrichatus TaxID=3080537 RepID=A0AAQ3QVJ1_9BACT|nr:DUF5060 domain-containing protein [Puniceicoccus sp. CR14]WOO40862.1 DUF5060 domain-containing protein [Puniceicoccus sp. CR14]